MRGMSGAPRRPGLALLGVATLLASSVALAASPAQASPAPTVFTVDSLADTPDANVGDGTCAVAGAGCTLRAAIAEADASAPGGATIAFAVAGSIRLLTKLPAISVPTVLDGSTGPGYVPATGPVVRLTCDDAPDVADGLVVIAADTTLRALEIDGCDTAISFGPGTDHARVFGTWIGTDDVPRAWPNNGLNGIVTRADDVVIGGPDPADGNIVNAQEFPVSLQDPVVDGTPVHARVQGNRIGLQPDGSDAVDFMYGVEVRPDVQALVGGTGPGEGNLISGGTLGVYFVDNGAGITVQGNRLGTDPTGTSAAGNNVGVFGRPAVGPRAGDAIPLIGGTAPGAGNLISGNRFNGIDLRTRAIVQGNLIGTNAAGTAAIPNGGIDYADNAAINVGPDGAIPDPTGPSKGVVVGGTTPAARNVIAGNLGEGIRLDAAGYQVLGNLIGVDVTGTVALPNAEADIAAGGDNAGPGQIGGVEPGEANTIAHGGGAGVEVLEGAEGSGGVTVRGNRIFDHDGLAIDLDQHGEPAGNGDQVAPTISSVTPGPAATTISGTVTSDRPGPLLVDVYASDTCQAGWGTGEGQEHLGTITVPYPGGNVDAPFSGTVANPTVGTVVTATTTQATNGTSQFSICGTVADLAVTARTNRSAATMDDEVAVELRITNHGPDPVTGLTVPVDLSTGEGSAVAAPIVETTQGSTTTSDWTVGDIDPGASASLCLRGDVTKTFYEWDYYGILKRWPTGFGISTSTSRPDGHDPYRGNDAAGAGVSILEGPPATPVVVDHTVCHGPDITVDDAARTRPTSGTAGLTFPVHLSRPETRPVTVAFRTVPGSAVAVEDFVARTGTLTIPAGATSASITVPVVGNTADEPTKAFTLELTDARHAWPTDGTATGTITANHVLGGCSAGSSDAERFVCHLYADALRRSPDAGGLAYWRHRLATGTARSTVARAFLGMDEALRTVADRPYVRYLGRHGTSGELQAWVDRYRAGSATAADTRIAILAGATYWAQAGAKPTTFVQHLYRDVFRRSADGAGTAYWVGRLAAGESRTTVAARMIGQPEGRRKIVGDVFLRFLRRDASPTEATTWVAKLGGGATEVDLGIALVAGAEYYAR